MRPLRIDMVSEHASPLATLGGHDAGGQNVHVASLATQLASKGHAVTVHTRRDEPTLAPFMPLAPGAWVHHVDAGPPIEVPKDQLFQYMDQFAAVLHEHWSRRRPDVVHSHFWMSGYAAALAAESLDIPLVHTFHALGIVKQRNQAEKDTSPACRIDTERSLLDRCHQVVATCSDEVFELLQMGASPEKLSVVPCGVDPSLFRPSGPTEERRPGLHRMLCVGRLVERKGIGTAIEALAGVPQAELVVVGGPALDEIDADPDVARLQRIASDNGVADRVIFRGRMGRSDLASLMRSADIVVCVPWYEPFGIVPLEAMACGVPVVASAVGGLTDSVVDGVTGCHVPPREVEALVAAVHSLLDDPERRAGLGAAGTERVRRRYTWQRVAESTVDVYRMVVRRSTAAKAHHTLRGEISS